VDGLALDAESDFAHTRTALDFLSKYQRADGKVPHEISQGANFVPWFSDYAYAYASADATPLYIVVMNDYVVGSGDVAFAQAEVGQLVEGLSVSDFHSTNRSAAEFFFRNWAWLGGGRARWLPVKPSLTERAGREALRLSPAWLTWWESETDKPSTSCPTLLGKGHVAAADHVIVHHDDIERSRIGRSVKHRRSR